MQPGRLALMTCEWDLGLLTTGAEGDSITRGVVASGARGAQTSGAERISEGGLPIT